MITTSNREAFMNATYFHNRISELNDNSNALHMPARHMRQQTEQVLRDMAYVLHLTSRVKQQMREDAPKSDWQSAGR
jgi:hypothetical protein